jgi:predicted DNA-binding transcriptional regulator AlpA
MTVDSKKIAAPQVGVATHIAVAPLAADIAHHPHDRQRVRGARAPSAKQVTAARRATNLPMRLLNRHEIVAMSGFTYPSLWEMMRRGRFPRGRVVGGKTMWRSDEIEEWLAALPVRALKGDAENTGGVA